MHFLKYNRHADGSSKKQVKRINKLVKYYILDGDILKYRKNFIKENFDLTVPKIEERLDLIKNAHNLGHFKSETVYYNLSSRYFWKSMKKEIENYINRCNICLKYDKKGIVEHPALALPIVSVLDRVSFYLVLGFPENSNGYIGCLVITDHCSKFLFVYKIKSKSMDEIFEKVLDWISIFGPPKEWLSDRGKKFVNELLNRLCATFNINRRFTSPYNPRANGLTERINQTLVSAL